MQRKLIILLLILTTTLCGHTAVTFKTSSVLSTGKWVKIKTAEAGIYELTYDQLKQYGFTDPTKVKVFGKGGLPVSEKLGSEFSDDLEQVPALRSGDRLYFYAYDTNELDYGVTDYTNFKLYRTVTQNSYADATYYFLSDSGTDAPLEISSEAMDDTTVAGITDWDTTSIASWAHKVNVSNPTRSGKNYLGEDMSGSCQMTFSVPVPEISDDGFVTVKASVGMKVTEATELTVSVNGAKVGTATAKASSDTYIYKLLTPGGSIVSSMAAVDGAVKVDLAIGKACSLARLDYLTLTYTADNRMPADSAQMLRTMRIISGHGIELQDVTPTTRAWLVSTPLTNNDNVFQNVDYTLRFDGSTARFKPSISGASYAEIVVFDTALTQKQAEYVGEVANQNLHARAVPDMLIITVPSLKEQAERLADYHREVDGMDVAVIPQEEIFNEFTAGIRDAMAYKRICKMFHSRNATKFRYLLFFGGANVDNRGLKGNDTKEMLVSYQSDASNHTVNSYTTDDFFTMMTEDDNSTFGGRIINFAVGRIPFAGVQDATKYVDKLLNRYKKGITPSDTWRNEILAIGEYGDNDSHLQQVESFVKNLQYANYDSSADLSTLKKNDTAVNINKICLEAYDSTDQLNATWDKLVEYLKSGLNMYLFIGHANTFSVTKPEVLFNLRKSADTHHDIAPVGYFSACDVGRFDSDQNYILSELLLNRRGGLIAGIASTREAYINYNGKTTDAFARSLAISKDSIGVYNGEKTIGRILMHTKNISNDRTHNRLKYTLFGDPAMPFDLPSTHVSVNKIDGKSTATTVSVGTMKNIPVSGSVNTAAGKVDTSFNGTAKVSIYDSERACRTTYGTDYIERGLLLTSVIAPVTNGVFTANAVIPANATLDDKIKTISVVAISEDGKVVDGRCEAMHIDDKLSSTEKDNQAPRITEMYVNDKAAFTDGMEIVGNDITLHATISDNLALNTSRESLQTPIRIAVDGNESTCRALNAECSDAQSCTIAQDISNLSEGRHTLTLTAGDMSGNVASRSVTIVIVNKATPTIRLSGKSLTDNATVYLDAPETYDKGELVVTDHSGKTCARLSDITFPYTWDGTDSMGNRLAEDVYDISAVVDGKSSATEKIVVARQ